MNSSSKISFEKTLSRDSTLFMQALWGQGMSGGVQKKFDWQQPAQPLIIHSANLGVIEIWENSKGIKKWFLDPLLAENKKGDEFMKNALAEYKKNIVKIKKFHAKKFISKDADLRHYCQLFYEASIGTSLVYYAGMDERNPENSKKLATSGRKEYDLFAEADFFVRRSLARRGKISEELSTLVLPDEIMSIPPERTLQRRRRGFLVIDGAKTFLGTVKEFSAGNPDYFFDIVRVANNVKRIKGQIAFKGVVRAEVKIVKKRSELEKVNKGDVLVSPMTTPDFLPAMKKAAAFVTDEGGITCHAAIVARELRKPCIIGTKIATKVLKDGDLVEVDAEKGTVKILKSTK